MMSASEVKANVRWQALSWTSEGYYSLYDYQRTAHNSGSYFFFPVIPWTWTAAMCLHTHTHKIYPSPRSCITASVLICRPVLGGIRSMESFKSDTAAETDRGDHLWRTLTEHFPAPQDHSYPFFFFFFWWSNWVRLNCPVMLIKNINFKCGKVFFCACFESNGLITVLQYYY